MSRWPRLLLYVCVACAALGLYTVSHVVNFPRYASTQGVGQYASQRHCNVVSQLPWREKYMLYAPHSGFSNQISELKNALLVAALLNRTLVLPPVFDHHAVALGSCPKFRVNEPHQMRFSALTHVSQLILQGRYVSIADIIDISAAVPFVRTIDFRIFASRWCAVDISSACSGPLCRRLVSSSSTWGNLDNCAALLSKPQDLNGDCVYPVEDDCRTTIWMHDMETTKLSELNKKLEQEFHSATSSTFSGTKKKRKHYKRTFKNIVDTLGRDSQAAKYQVLSFGSLFSSEYKGVQLHVDIESSTDRKVQNLLKAISVLPFTPPIRNAGIKYSKMRVKHPFFCAQLRLLDGQFKNHWEKTFSNLENQLNLAKEQKGGSQVLHVFVMTDLPRSNWTGTYLEKLDMEKSAHKVHIVEEGDPIIIEAAAKISSEDYGLRSGFVPLDDETIKTDTDTHTPKKTFSPDILLYVEEVVCSCATLGFVGTSGSTLTSNIMLLRDAKTCRDANT